MWLSRKAEFSPKEEELFLIHASDRCGMQMELCEAKGGNRYIGVDVSSIIMEYK
jgi:hypothetical protein